MENWNVIEDATLKVFLWTFHKSERLDTIHLFLLEQQTNLNWFYLSYLQSWTDPRWVFCNQPEKETTHNPYYMGSLEIVGNEDF